MNKSIWSNKNFILLSQLLTILFIIISSISTIPGLDKKFGLFFFIEHFIVVFFVFEYFLNVLKNKTNYILSFYGFVDIIIIICFYLPIVSDMNFLRVLKLVILLKFTKYNNSMKKFIKIFHTVKDEFVLFFILILILLYLSAFGIYFFEKEAQPENFKTIFHSLWWSLSTLTTVGYGDVFPITLGGKLFTFFILIIGLGVVAVPSGLLVSAFIKTKEK